LWRSIITVGVSACCMCFSESFSPNQVACQLFCILIYAYLYDMVQVPCLSVWIPRSTAAWSSMKSVVAFIVEPRIKGIVVHVLKAIFPLVNHGLLSFFVTSHTFI
jgi:hypothetical protein